jgi:hypothetical protein
MVYGSQFHCGSTSWPNLVPCPVLGLPTLGAAGGRSVLRMARRDTHRIMARPSTHQATASVGAASGPDCSATRMADGGANAHALMATFGWLDIKQAELYTRHAERKRLASENAHLLGTNSGEIFPTLKPQNRVVRKKGAKK